MVQTMRSSSVDFDWQTGKSRCDETREKSKAFQQELQKLCIRGSAALRMDRSYAEFMRKSSLFLQDWSGFEKGIDEQMRIKNGSLKTLLMVF
jgi:hypothetical protein